MKVLLWLTFLANFVLSVGSSVNRASVVVEKDCYDEHENAIVSFTNPHANYLDWIGVYDADTVDIYDLGEPIAWIYLCGSQACSKATESGAFAISSLPPGNYVAVIARSDGHAYLVLATSETFRVGGCDSPSCSIVDVLQQKGRFELLLAAVGVAGLEGSLMGDDQLTLFAPNDHAFSLLGDDVLQDLLNRPNVLADILLYHVVAGKVLSSQLQTGPVPTLQGITIQVEVTMHRIILNRDRSVVHPDIVACNGVIHEIDGVLLPPHPTPPPSPPKPAPKPAPKPVPAPSSKTILDWLLGTGDFTLLLAALDATGLDDTLASPGSYTLFAPNDDAFAKLGQHTIEALIADPDTLRDILLYHVVPARVKSKKLRNVRVSTLNGDEIIATRNSGYIILNGDTKVLHRDVYTSNGIVHVIDMVLIPPSHSAPAPAPEPSGVSISTNDHEYFIGETIQVHFSYHDPIAGDWVGLYDAYDDYTGEPILYLYTCGDQHCDAAAMSGALLFGEGHPDESYRGNMFPLHNGEYVAVLARGHSKPYHVLGKSSIFKVKSH